MRNKMAGLLLAGLGCFALSHAPAWADPFCCECKDGKKHSLDESNIAVAGTKCSLKCKRPVLPTKGACEAPAATAPGAGGVVMMFASDNCSGEGVRIEKSEAALKAGSFSYQVESGMVRAYEKGNFGGAGTQPIVGSMCVSPGWAIGSVKIGE